MNLNHLPVARKLWALVLGLMLSMLVLLAGLLGYLMHIDDEAGRVVQFNEDRITLALRWKGMSALAVDRVVNAVASNDEALSERLVKQSQEGIQAINGVQQQIEAALFSAADKEQFLRVMAARKLVLEHNAEAGKLRANLDHTGARALLDGKMLPAVDRYVAEQDAFVHLQERQRDEAKLRAGEQRQRALWMGVGLALAVVLLGMVLAAMLVRSIIRPLGRAVGLADTIAAGDLTQDVHDERRDELGQLLRALSAMGARLRGVVGEVRAGVESVSAASS